MEEFINHQKQLIETEKKLDVESTLELLSSLTPKQLQKKGLALVGLKAAGVFV